MINIQLLTQNPDKLRIAQTSFADYGITVVPSKYEEPEIQAETSQIIARHTALNAHRALGGAVLREDHSFYIEELGIPGPFMAYADKTVTAKQLVRIADTLESRKAHFEIAAAFVDTDGELFENAYKVPIDLATKPAGNPKLNWERVMMLEGSGTTFAETDSTERDHVWNGNYRVIAEFLITKSGR